MKKIITAILAISMVAAMSTIAFAAELNQGSDPKTQDSEITTSIAPTYVVTIPADAKINFNAGSTVLGTIQASHMQIEPDKQVVVAAKAGELENQIDKEKSIPYKLTSGDGEFLSIALIDTVKKADLSVAITADDWNKAYAGNYKGTITFTISYADKAVD
ncbi:MAG: hypothetical protein RSA93_07225 [Longicatena sp.]